MPNRRNRAETNLRPVSFCSVYFPCVAAVPVAFSAVVLDAFPAAVLDAFPATVLDAFPAVVLDAFHAVVLDTFPSRLTSYPSSGSPHAHSQPAPSHTFVWFGCLPAPASCQRSPVLHRSAASTSQKYDVQGVSASVSGCPEPYLLSSTLD